MERRGVERRRAEPNPLRRPGDQQQGIERRLVEKVVEDGDHLEAGALRAQREGDVLGRALVRLEAETELVQPLFLPPGDRSSEAAAGSREASAPAPGGDE